MVSHLDQIWLVHTYLPTDIIYIWLRKRVIEQFEKFLAPGPYLISPESE